MISRSLSAVIGFGVLFGLVAPHHYRLGGDRAIFNIVVGVLAPSREGAEGGVAAAYAMTST